MLIKKSCSQSIFKFLFEKMFASNAFMMVALFVRGMTGSREVYQGRRENYG